MLVRYIYYNGRGCESRRILFLFDFYLKNVEKRGKKGLILEKSLKKCAKKRKITTDFANLHGICARKMPGRAKNY
jgi:hypothetical protein